MFSPTPLLVIAVQGISTAKAKVEMMCSGRHVFPASHPTGCGTHPRLVAHGNDPRPGPSTFPVQATGYNVGCSLKYAALMKKMTEPTSKINLIHHGSFVKLSCPALLCSKTRDYRSSSPRRSEMADPGSAIL